MTNEAALISDPQAASQEPRNGGRLALLAGLCAITLLAVAGGAGIAFLIATPASAPAGHADEGADGGAVPLENPAAYATVAGPLTLVPLQPVVTNIASPSSAIVRIEASLVLRADADIDPAILAAQVGADTLAFARSLELAQIEGARGLMHLREDLKERATLRSPAVADYVLHSLIAQ